MSVRQFFLLSVFCVSGAFAAENSSPFSLQMELLGKGGLYSIQGQTHGKNFGAGAGFSLFKNAALIPVFLSLNTSGPHAFVFEPGATIATDTHDAYVFYHLGFGYRFLERRQFYFKAMGYILIAPGIDFDDDYDDRVIVFPWVGFTVGYPF